MTLLQNFDFATKYLDYQSQIEVQGILDPKISGWYKFVNGLLSALLVIDGKLYFLYGADRFLIMDSHRILLKRTSKDKNECILINGNNVLLRFSYLVPDLELNISPFEYLDREDFIWEIFLSKIINDQDRKRNFIANLKTDQDVKEKKA